MNSTLGPDVARLQPRRKAPRFSHKTFYTGPARYVLHEEAELRAIKEKLSAPRGLWPPQGV